MKENFYHGVFLGFLSHCEDWYVRSNAESGDAYSDILIEASDDNIVTGTGIIIEIKYSENTDLEAGCKKALQQIENNNYVEALINEEIDNILKYGVWELSLSWLSDRQSKKRNSKSCAFC